MQSWVGAQANVAVAQYLLEHELGYRVDTVQVDEVPAWDALSQGRVDAILEDWGHPEQEQRYVKDKKTIANGGDLGVTGHIGWFVPTYFAKQHPDVTDWKNLNKYADQLRTPESGGKGQLLDGSPSYVTNDKALVKNLDLDSRWSSPVRRPPRSPRCKQFAKEKKPFLTLLVRPQWLFEKVPDDGGEAARVQGGLRRRPGEGRLRLSAHPAAEVPQHGLREERRQGGRPS